MGKPKLYCSNGPASRSVGLTVEALKLDVDYMQVKFMLFHRSESNTKAITAP